MSTQSMTIEKAREERDKALAELVAEPASLVHLARASEWCVIVEHLAGGRAVPTAASMGYVSRGVVR